VTSGWTACRYGAADEALHPPDGVPLYNESVYFNFVTGQDVGPRGGVVRVGLRPTDGYAELSLHLAMGDGAVRFAYERHPLAADDFVAGTRTWRCGRMVAEALEPTRRWRMAFRGDAVAAIADPVAFGRDPGATLRSRATSGCAFDLEFEAAHPLHALTESGDLAPHAGTAYARDHYEQFGALSGDIEVDGERWAITRCPAFRDHSWGPRDWQAAPWMTFATVYLDGGPERIVGIAQRTADGDRAHGLRWDAGGMSPLVAMDVRCSYSGGVELSPPLSLRLETERSAMTLDAEIEAYLPLRHRSGDRMVRTAQALLRLTGDQGSARAWMDLTRPADG
jgi:hypothetical protein